MGQPLDRSPFTLAQLARRAGISEGRARALHTATPSGLPTPNSRDADGRPLWWASTIDAWCARTRREVSEDSLWLFRAPRAVLPAPELQRRVITLGRDVRRQEFYVIVWDTEHGHLIYLQPLNGTGGDHKDWLAHHAAELIEPRWWADAVVIMPIEETLNFYPDIEHAPQAYVYRLTSSPADSRGATGDTAFSGLRRFFQRTDPQLVGPATPTAAWAGQMDLADISAALGRPIPLWLSDTATTAHAEQNLSYDRTFTVPDTVTEWPAVQDRVTRAITADLPGQYPCAFAALAVDAEEELTRIRAAHEHTPDAGPGWYLTCRPARPALPIELEQRITGATLVADRELVGKELTELRQEEGEMDIDDPRGEAYAEAVTLLELQLRYAAKAASEIHDLGNDYVPVADNGVLRYTAPWDGPVVEAWRGTLTPVPDLAAVLRLRRVRRIIRYDALEDIREGYRDEHGRYVLVIRRNVGDWSLAEWPISLQATAAWTDKTVITGDDSEGTVTTLLALTPTDDGRMRVDPVPLPPRSDRDAFAYGYTGGTPGTTFRALLRCALGDDTRLPLSANLDRDENNNPASQLWTAISTTKGPLRLSWPQLKMWARADHKRAEST